MTRILGLSAMPFHCVHTHRLSAMIFIVFTHSEYQQCLSFCSHVQNMSNILQFHASLCSNTWNIGSFCICGPHLGICGRFRCLYNQANKILHICTHSFKILYVYACPLHQDPVHICPPTPSRSYISVPAHSFKILYICTHPLHQDPIYLYLPTPLRSCTSVPTHSIKILYIYTCPLPQDPVHLYSPTPQDPIYLCLPILSRSYISIPAHSLKILYIFANPLPHDPVYLCLPTT